MILLNMIVIVFPPFCESDFFMDYGFGLRTGLWTNLAYKCKCIISNLLFILLICSGIVLCLKLIVIYTILLEFPFVTSTFICFFRYASVKYFYSLFKLISRYRFLFKFYFVSIMFIDSLLCPLNNQSCIV